MAGSSELWNEQTMDLPLKFTRRRWLVDKLFNFKLSYKKLFWWHTSLTHTVETGIISAFFTAFHRDASPNLRVGFLIILFITLQTHTDLHWPVMSGVIIVAYVLPLSSRTSCPLHQEKFRLLASPSFNVSMFVSCMQPKLLSIDCSYPSWFQVLNRGLRAWTQSGGGRRCGTSRTLHFGSLMLSYKPQANGRQVTCLPASSGHPSALMHTLYQIELMTFARIQSCRALVHFYN